MEDLSKNVCVSHLPVHAHTHARTHARTHTRTQRTPHTHAHTHIHTHTTRYKLLTPNDVASYAIVVTTHTHIMYLLGKTVMKVNQEINNTSQTFNLPVKYIFISLLLMCCTCIIVNLILYCAHQTTNDQDWMHHSIQS